jgi:hypothetical protein
MCSSALFFRLTNMFLNILAESTISCLRWGLSASCHSFPLCLVKYWEHSVTVTWLRRPSCQIPCVCVRGGEGGNNQAVTGVSAGNHWMCQTPTDKREVFPHIV